MTAEGAVVNDEEDSMNGALETLPVEVEQGPLVTRYAEWGEMAVRYARAPAGTDMGPLLEGLPGDRCPSPHWGVVLEGAVRRHAPRRMERRTRRTADTYW